MGGSFLNLKDSLFLDISVGIGDYCREIFLNVLESLTNCIIQTHEMQAFESKGFHIF